MVSITRAPGARLHRVAPPGARPAPRGQAPADLVDLSASPPGEPSSASARGRWALAAALALAVALPHLAGGAWLLGQTRPEPCQAATSRPEASRPQARTETPPVTGLQHQRMADLARVTEGDEPVARQVKELYGRLADQAWRHSETYSEAAWRLRTEADRMERFLSLGPGLHPAEGFTVTVDAAGTRVVVEGPGLRRELVRGATGLRLVTEEGSLEESEYTRTVRVGETTYTLHRKDHHGYGAGDFEVESPLVRGRQRLYARGLSLLREETQTLSGYAGDLKVTRRDRFEVPEVSILPAPRNLMTYTSERITEDVEMGKVTLQTREVQVRDDGTALETCRESTVDRAS